MNELEKSLNQLLDKANKEDLKQLLIKRSIENLELIEDKKELNEKLVTFDKITNTDDWMTVRELAKELNYKKIGPNKMLAIFREIKLLRYNNEPYAQFYHQGYCKLIKVTKEDSYGNIRTFDMPVFSTESIDYIRRKLDEYINKN